MKIKKLLKKLRKSWQDPIHRRVLLVEFIQLCTEAGTMPPQLEPKATPEPPQAAPTLAPPASHSAPAHSNSNSNDDEICDACLRDLENEECGDALNEDDECGGTIGDTPPAMEVINHIYSNLHDLINMLWPAPPENRRPGNRLPKDF